MTKYVMREMYDMNGVGEKRAYPHVVELGQILEDEFVSRLGDSTGLNQSMVESVLAGMSDKLAQLMGLGYSVKVRGIGTFGLSLRVKGDKDCEVLDQEGSKRNAQSVEVRNIRFKADKTFVTRASHWCKFERDGESRISKVKTTENERRLAALEFIDKNLIMNVDDYARLTGLSRTMASKELRKFRNDPASEIGTKGRSSHIVYIRKELA